MYFNPLKTDVTMCTMYLNIKTSLHFAHRVHLHVQNDSNDKEWLLP